MNTSGIVSLISRTRNRANNYLAELLEDHGLSGLSSSHGDILSVLINSGTMPMNQLARRIDRKKNTVTVLVEKLLKLGYVKKEKDNEDNRIFNISLSEKGKRDVSAFNGISEKLITDVYRGFSEDEKDKVMVLLERIYINLGKGDEKNI